MSYACLAHGRQGETPELACPECREAQLAAQAAAGKNNLQFFRNLDKPARAPKSNPWIKPLPSPEYVASLPPAAVEASAELAEALEEERFAAALGRALQSPSAVPMAEVDGALVALAPTGPRIAGIDPGLRWIAITIAALTPEGPRFVASTVIEVASSRGPKRAPTDEDMDRALVQVVAHLEARNVERVAIERASHFHGGDRPGSGGLAAGLLRGQWIGGLIAGALRAAHRYNDAGQLVRSVPDVRSVRAKDWRDYARKPNPQAPWSVGVRAAFGGTLPEHPGEHVLDAAGICAWLTKPADKPRRPRPPGAKRSDKGRPTASRNGARAAATAAKRAAAGCVCPGKLHTLPDCPIKLAGNVTRAEKMRGNTNRTKASNP